MLTSKRMAKNDVNTDGITSEDVLTSNAIVVLSTAPGKTIIIFNSFEVRIENYVMRVNIRHHVYTERRNFRLEPNKHYGVVFFSVKV